MNNRSISFYTLGCRLNQSETAVVERTFLDKNYRVVDFNDPADIVVINTCTVTENGDADTRRLINKANRLNPQARIALIGCQAQVQKDKLAKLPNVRWIVGNERKMELADIIRQLDDENVHVITPPISRQSFTVPTAGIDSRHIRANIKIQDGCDFFCSFCEIPYARGRSRSRVFEDILREAKVLVKAGHKEIVLTGINIGTYVHQERKFLDVIEALEQIVGLERIRISSIEPTTIPLKLITKMAQRTKLCRYLHIPLQSGSDKILLAMKRKYTYRSFLGFIEAAVERVPQICVGTDIIVGFPGEIDEDFEETAEKIKDIPVHYCHVFSYSQRYLAQSRNLGHPVPSEAIKRRSEIVRSLSQRKRWAYFQQLVGSTQQVLFEKKKDGVWDGLTDNYIRVAVRSDQDLTNQVRNVILLKAYSSMMEGEIIH